MRDLPDADANSNAAPSGAMYAEPRREAHAAASGVIAALLEARQWMTKYTSEALSGATSDTKNLAAEAKRKTTQLVALVRRIDRAHDRMFDGMERMLTRQRVGAMADIVIDAESFYYFAFRARQIVRDLPGLGAFECSGVRDVRNHLVEHPDKKNHSGVLMNSFGCGMPRGPVIKAVRLSHQVGKNPDAGLYVNALEFAHNLSKTIERYLSGSP
jgi:hypothetical protein